MDKGIDILKDGFGRKHTYLRISLIERCNLACTYCMPEEGIRPDPRSHLMSYEEIYEISSLFVKHGVTKIRLTGGEPFVRKDIQVILRKLSSLNVELSITTNAVLVNRHIDALKENGIKNINVSIDSLRKERFAQITRKDEFNTVYNNIFLLLKEGFNVKVNVVLIKGFNSDEIIDFIELTKSNPLSLRFIEFMPFNGNKWNMDKLVSYDEIMQCLHSRYTSEQIVKTKDAPNDTAKNFKIKEYRGSFGIISSVTNPFCDSCNRIRLTANGRLKNCLFSSGEEDLLTPLRQGKDIVPIVQEVVQKKQKIRGGMSSIGLLKNPEIHSKNRSMITIGG